MNTKYIVAEIRDRCFLNEVFRATTEGECIAYIQLLAEVEKQLTPELVILKVYTNRYNTGSKNEN